MEFLQAYEDADVSTLGGGGRGIREKGVRIFNSLLEFPTPEIS